MEKPADPGALQVKVDKLLREIDEADVDKLDRLDAKMDVVIHLLIPIALSLRVEVIGLDD